MGDPHRQVSWHPMDRCMGGHGAGDNTGALGLRNTQREVGELMTSHAIRAPLLESAARRNTK